jgi:hypothetical protein
MSQGAADPAMTLMKSRRRIASSKAWGYVDLALNTAITAGISERQNGSSGRRRRRRPPSSPSRLKFRDICSRIWSNLDDEVRKARPRT